MNENGMNHSVRVYLREIEKDLPDWLKNKKEHKEILADLEEHIWSKAAELSENGQPNQESVSLAIDHMGTPQNIVKEYKRRGEPKFYITKELWSMYIKTLSIVIAIIVGVTIFSLIISFLTEIVSFETLVVGLASGIQSSLLLAFTIVSIIFVALSMQGYFPEDFRKRSKKKVSDKDVSASKTLKPALKPFIKPIGVIVGGGIGLVIGIVLLSQPFPTDMFFPDFLMILRFFGLISIIESSLDISRGIIGNRRPKTHQVLHIIAIPFKLSAVPFLVILMDRPDIFPFFSEPWIHIGIPVEFYGLYRVIIGVLIAVVNLTTIENYYNIFKIQKYKK